MSFKLTYLSEYVVNCIVERKKISDLFQSFDDGRYEEQKWRLQKSGITKRIYLVEGSISHLPFPAQTRFHDSILQTQLGMSSVVTSGCWTLSHMKSSSLLLQLFTMSFLLHCFLQTFNLCKTIPFELILSSSEN